MPVPCSVCGGAGEVEVEVVEIPITNEAIVGVAGMLWEVGPIPRSIESKAVIAYAGLMTP